jgi:SNF2 family DNA or RNA helicase
MLDLPPKNVIPEFIDMDDKQTKLYEEISNGIIDEIDRVNISEGNLLGMIVRLRQATSCPSVLSSNFTTSTKIERAVELTEELISNNEKVVIFSTFKEPINILAEKLKEYKPLIATGDIDDTIVSDNIDKFQNDESYKIFLGTTQKVGTGQTLTAASYMIHIDTHWT